MGEDPFLAASMSGPEVRAISDHGVNATMKHYAVYNQEAGRVGDQPSGSAPTVDNIVSEKALREIYLPPFEAAVKVGGAGAVMCSFPRVNGTYACENAHLFDILKREWGFDGSVGPDFPSAQRSITRAVMAGLDSGSFAASPFNAALAQEKPLAQAVRDGDVPEARIDDMILRRLVPLFRLDQYDNPPGKGVGGRLDARASRYRRRDPRRGHGAAEERRRHPAARQAGQVGRADRPAGQARMQPWSSRARPIVKPVHLEPVLPAVQARAGDRITSLKPTERLGSARCRRSTRRKSGQPTASLAGAQSISPTPIWISPPRRSPVRWSPILRSTRRQRSRTFRPTTSGPCATPPVFTPAESGVHRFTLHGSGSARLLVGGKPQAGFELADFGNAAYANVELQAGQPVALEIDYTPRSALRDQRMTMFGLEMGLTLRVGHAPPDDLIAKAVDASQSRPTSPWSSPANEWARGWTAPACRSRPTRTG